MRFWSGHHRDDGNGASSFPWGWGWRRIVAVFGLLGLVIGFAIVFAAVRLLR